MRKILSLLMLFCAFVGSAWAQTSLRVSEGLLATQENTQYKWTSAKLSAPTEGEFNKIRVTFLKTSNNEKPAGFPCVAIAEFYLYDKDGNAVTLTETDFSSNATQGNEGKISALCNGAISKQDGEGDYDWYWHSQWSGTPTPYGYHYLELDLKNVDKEKLSEYQIGWVTRRVQASPAEVVISTGATTEEAAKNANTQMLPQVSTNLETQSVKFYTIKSVRTKNFLAYDQTKAKPQQINAVNNNCYWYFTQGTDGKVVMHNVVSGKVLGTNYEMASTGEWYVSPAGYRPGVVFSTTADVTQSNCIDDQSGTIGPWKHIASDNEGTTWLAEEVVNAPVDVPVLSLNGMKITSIGEPTTELVLDKWYILNNVGRGNYVSQEGNNWKMRGTENVAAGDLAKAKAGYLFKITKNGEYYNIMSGNGKYFQLGDNTASTSATPVNFEIGKIDESANNFYLFDKDHGYAADGQLSDESFVGWSTTPPATAGGNDSYKLLPVELADLGEIGVLKEELAAALAAAQTKYSSVNIAPGVNNYSAPADIEEQFAAIVAFCNSIDGNTTVDAINAKKAELETLIASVKINMPVNGKFYRVRCAGNGMKYLQSDLDESNAEDIRLKVLSGEKSVAATFCYVDGTLVSYTTGKSINAYRYDAVGTKSTVEFSEASNGKPGRYNIKVGNRFIFGASDNNKIDSGAGTPDNRDGYTWWLEDVNTIPVTITEAGYATFYAPVALTLPEGLTAYTVSAQSETSATLEEVEGVIPANTGVVLAGEANTYELAVAEAAEAVEGNLLQGSVAASYVTAPAYVLGYVGEEVGFYVAKMTDDQWLNNGFKAYLPKTVNSARFISFDFGTETGIDELKGENGNVKTVIYDLSGRRVQGAQKGIFIVNGKKVVK